jgi:hypothetical protein
MPGIVPRIAARAIERRVVADRRAALEAEYLRRRESDFASLDAELPPAPKRIEKAAEKRVDIEREAPLPVTKEILPAKKTRSAKETRPSKVMRTSDEEASGKPKRKRRQREGPPNPRTRRTKGSDDDLNPRP